MHKKKDINKSSEMYIYNYDKHSEDNTPSLFKTKNNKKTIKALTHIRNDTGKTRHYTPAAQEWFNSIYKYNPNYIKSLPVADTNLMYLLKAYFSSQLKKTKPKTTQITIRNRRLSTKKIFVGRGELKHSASKVFITFYVYNTEKIFFKRAIYILNRALYAPVRALSWEIVKDKNKKKIIRYNRMLSFSEFWSYIGKAHYYHKWCTKLFVRRMDYINLYLSNINMQYDILTLKVNLKLITLKEKNEIFSSLYKDIVSNLPDPPFEKAILYYEKKYTIHLYNLILQLKLNIDKFRYSFITKLIDLVEKIYDKKVELNIVKLKRMHLNSDIYTQAVALKLRNRNNKLYRVLKSSLRKVKLPAFYRVNEIYHEINKDELLVNKIRNDNISSMFSDINVNDPLNNLLVNLFPDGDSIKAHVVRKKSTRVGSISLQNYVLKYLKHLNIRGIRVEAKGRLTRRLIASRSIFKMKWKGGLKNVDSSFKGLSAILLRGHVKSNVQHSFISSKNRNGAFGVNGYISSK